MISMRLAIPLALSIAALVASCSSIFSKKGPSEKREVQLPLDRPRLFVHLKPVESLPTDEKVSRRGLEVTWVYEWGATRKSGLQAGDVILAVNGKPLDRYPKDRMDPDFTDVIHQTAPGKELHLTILRWSDHRSLLEDGKKSVPSLDRSLRELIGASDPGHSYDLDWKRSYEILELSPIPGDSVSGRGDVAALPDEKIGPEWLRPAEPPLEKLVQELGDHYKIRSQLSTQRSWLARLAESGDAFRIQLVNYLLRHPFATGEAAQAVLAPIEGARAGNATEAAGRVLEVSTRLMSPGSRLTPAPERMASQGSSRDTLARIEKLLERADQLRSEAFSGLTSDERGFLESQAEETVAALSDPDKAFKSDTDAATRNRRLLALAGRVRIAPLGQAADLLLELTRKDFLQGLRAALKREGVDLGKAELARRHTPLGDIVVGGSAEHWYRDLKDVAILIKFGGHNTFSNSAGASVPGRRLQAVITLDADNEFYSNTQISQGAGVLGVGLLANLGKTRDFYLAEDAAQGFGFLGVGLCLDEGERSRFRASTLAQGAGFDGIGTLVATGKGHLFDSHQLSQGAGVAGGVGALINQGGQSEYLLKGRFASGYETPGTYTALGQGTGYGLREVASGGVGILYDGQGGSSFNAGDFAQGGGYYYGWGILKTAGRGSNVFKGSRYAQGYSAHYAIGTLLGGPGDDRYECLDRACTGISHDLAVSWFEDAGGSNRYQCPFFSNGSSTHNSISVWIDRSNRGYCEGPLKPASPQGNNYHGGTSLSLVSGLNGNPAFPAVPGGNPMQARDDYFFLFNPRPGRALEDFANPTLLDSAAPPLTRSPDKDYVSDER